MIRPAPDFERQIAKAGFSKPELAATAGVSLSGLYAIVDPAQQPKRKGGVRAKTAWAIARAVASKTGKTEDEEYDRLFQEVEAVAVDGRRINETPTQAEGPISALA